MNTVICPICGKEYKQLIAQHIFNHGLTIEEFKLKFPESYLGSPGAEAIRKEKMVLQFEKENIRCKYCNKLITTPDRKRKVFCNKECKTNYFNIHRVPKNLKGKHFEKICCVCNKEYKAFKIGSKYCSGKCHKEHISNKRIKEWKDATSRGENVPYKRWMRKYLFEKYDSKCCKCGWNKVNPFTGNVPLELEHIDGNSNNNKEENLELLCPCCHALTSTYKGANRGNGRFSRRKRYQEGKSY